MKSKHRSRIAEESDENGKSIDRGIVELINEEISYIRTERLKPGWTVWAIIATLSSLAWLVLIELESNVINLESTTTVIGLSGYIYIFIITLRALISNRKTNSQPRFTSSLLIPNLTVLYFLETIIHASLILIAYFLQGKLNPVTTITAYIFNAVNIAFLLYVPLLNKSLVKRRIFFEKDIELTKSIKSLFLSLVLTSAFLAFMYFQHAVQVHLLITVNDVKIICLLIGIMYLLLVLADIQIRSPELDNLVEIRRDYVLGKISLEEAKKKTDYAISGMKASDVQNEYRQAFTELMNSAEKEMNEASKLINRLSKLYQNGKARLSRKEHNEIRNVNQKIYDRFHNYSLITTKQFYSLFVRSMRLVSQYGTEALPAIGFLPFVNEIKERIANTNELRQSLAGYWLQMLVENDLRNTSGDWKNKLDKLRVSDISVEIKSAPQQRSR